MCMLTAAQCETRDAGRGARDSGRLERGVGRGKQGAWSGGIGREEERWIFPPASRLSPPASRRRPATRPPRPATRLTREASGLLRLESPAGTIGPWMHAGWAITLIRSRAVVRLESRRSISVDSETILLVPALHAYSIRLEDVTSPTVTLLFDGRRYHNPSAASLLPAITTGAELVGPFVQLVAELARPVRSVDPTRGISPLLERLMAESTPVGAEPISIVATPLLPLRDYLSANLTAPVSTATLAERSGLTESHFIRAFHHEFGLPPHAYHMRLRLAEASKLLARGDSVSTVAYDCGFADQSHLSRKFKEVYGVAPGEWASVVGEGFPRVARDRLSSVSQSRRRRASAKTQHIGQWQR